MKTFIVHISVDANSLERADVMVRDCITAGALSGCFHPERGEVVVVLNNTEEVEE